MWEEGELVCTNACVHMRTYTCMCCSEYYLMWEDGAMRDDEEATGRASTYGAAHLSEGEGEGEG